MSGIVFTLLLMSSLAQQCVPADSAADMQHAFGGTATAALLHASRGLKLSSASSDRPWGRAYTGSCTP